VQIIDHLTHYKISVKEYIVISEIGTKLKDIHCSL